MKPVKQIMKAILDDMKTNLQPIIANHGIKIDSYVFGFPIDPEKLIIGVWLAEGNDDANNKLVYSIQVQLPGIEEVDAYRYIDAVNEYLNDFNPQIAGYTDGSFMFVLRDGERKSSIEIIYSITLTSPKDDCD